MYEKLVKFSAPQKKAKAYVELLVDITFARNDDVERKFKPDKSTLSLSVYSHSNRNYFK